MEVYTNTCALPYVRASPLVLGTMKSPVAGTSIPETDFRENLTEYIIFDGKIIMPK